MSVGRDSTEVKGQTSLPVGESKVISSYLSHDKVVGNTSQNSELVKAKKVDKSVDINSEEIIVSCVKSCRVLNLVVPISINGIDTAAVVDSAAQVTIINHDLLLQAGYTIPTVTNVTLKGIGGKNATLAACKLEGIKIKLGNSNFVCDVYAANIEDPVLLGLDFLVNQKCKIDLVDNSISLPGEKIVATLKKSYDGEKCKIFEVKMPKQISVPPGNSAVPVSIVSANASANYVVEFSDKLKGLVPSSSVVKSNGLVDILNNTNHPIRLQAQAIIGTAVEVAEIKSLQVCDGTNKDGETAKLKSLSGSSTANCKTQDVETAKLESSSNDLARNLKSSTSGSSQTTTRSISEIIEHLPDHLTKLFKDTKQGQPTEHLAGLGLLLIDYSDIFARHDLDLGCFSGIKHKIVTGDAPPVKSRMRRTPIGFENEEKKHLDRMLEAGVIRSSESEWSSPPVLVRKKDGTVR